MTALIRYAPYGGRVAVRAARGALHYQRYRYRYAVAGRVARMALRSAWKNRKRIRAAIKFTAAKKRRFSKRQIGEKVGSGTAKKISTSDTIASITNTRSLQQLSLTSLITEGTLIHNRERKMINLRGFKICMQMNNKGPLPLHVSVAVISPKSGNSVTTVDFFRDTSGSNERARNFGTALSGVQYECLPINIDKYVVLRHKRYMLTPGGTVSPDFKSESGNSFLSLSWWLPINRQLRYNDTTGEPEANAIFLVWWCDRHFATAGSGGAADLEILKHTICYFREPKN